MPEEEGTGVRRILHLVRIYLEATLPSLARFYLPSFLPPALVYLFSFFFLPSSISALDPAKQKATGYMLRDPEYRMRSSSSTYPSGVPCIFCRAASQNQKVGVSFSSRHSFFLFSSLLRTYVRYGWTNGRATRDSMYITLNASAMFRSD